MGTADDDRTAIGRVMDYTETTCPYCDTDNVYKGVVVGEDVCCEDRNDGCGRTYTVVSESSL